MNVEAVSKLKSVIAEAMELYPPEIKDGNVVKTFCNFGVNHVCSAMGFDGFKGMMANQMVFTMQHSPFFSEVYPEVAKEIADNGKIVIAGLQDDPHGHVAVVYPGKDMVMSGKWKMRVPQVGNVGKENRIMGANYAFGSAPKYYAFVRKEQSY